MELRPDGVPNLSRLGTHAGRSDPVRVTWRTSRGSLLPAGPASIPEPRGRSDHNGFSEANEWVAAQTFKQLRLCSNLDRYSAYPKGVGAGRVGANDDLRIDRLEEATHLERSAFPGLFAEVSGRYSLPRLVDLSGGIGRAELDTPFPTSYTYGHLGVSWSHEGLDLELCYYRTDSRPIRRWGEVADGSWVFSLSARFPREQ